MIHGNKTPGGAHRALDEFKTGRLRVLVATDIAARGLDIAQLPLVVNFDLPLVAEDYVHRVGRTGRAGPHRARRVAGVGVGSRASASDPAGGDGAARARRSSHRHREGSTPDDRGRADPHRRASAVPVGARPIALEPQSADQSRQTPCRRPPRRKAWPIVSSVTVTGESAGRFVPALIAWPLQREASGVMWAAGPMKASRSA